MSGKYLSAAGVLLLFILLSPAPCAAGETALIGFELTDQFDRPHRDTELRSTTLLVVGSGRKGSEFQGGWMVALRARLQDHLTADELRIVEVADLRGVPFFLKGTVKRRFPEDRRNWVLMDWKGRFARAYDLDGDRCNILVFDATGRLVHRAAGREVEAKALDRVRAAVDALPSATR